MSGRLAWAPAYDVRGLLLDATAGAAGGALAIRGVPIGGVAGTALAATFLSLLALALCGLAWVGALAATGALVRRLLPQTNQIRRISTAAVLVAAALGVYSVVSGDLGTRSLLLVGLPSALVLSGVGRVLLRSYQRRARDLVPQQIRTLMVGPGRAVTDLLLRLTAEGGHGLHVIGACVPADDEIPVALPVPVLTSNPDDIPTVVDAMRVETVILAGAGRLAPMTVRKISWTLEGTGVELLVAPGLEEIAGSRLGVRAAGHVPFLALRPRRMGILAHTLKSVCDRVVACTALVVLAPVLVLLAIVVRMDSPGPAFFVQTRIGRAGQPFRMFKFRTMVHNADRLLASLEQRNDHGDGVLFKMKEDPRITRIGHHLRRWSLDELPQLLNVALGHMSLIGPRPPLPQEVARYDQVVHRRLLVKPGLTGLWQVSGRSTLDWDESVRLDLRYVDNWSFMMDAGILWRTGNAVRSHTGAW